MKPDQTLVLAVERGVTGATAHKLRNLLQMYLDYCYIEDVKKADETKREVYAALRQSRGRVA